MQANLSTLPLLEELLMARGPGGQEDEVRQICMRELEPHCDKTWVDPAGNVIGLIEGAANGSDTQTPVRVMAHLDEIAMLVKRVESDGTLRVVALGGANPINFGVCPVDILGDQDFIPGVLSFGSMHSTAETHQGADVLSGNVHWEDVHVITRCSREQLHKHGVRPGTRVVLSQHWRRPFRAGDAIAAHFLDDRAPMVATLQAAALLAERRAELVGEVYFVFTTQEEESNAGALYAAAHLPGEVTVAVEVGPVVAEYGTRLSVNPIINTGDEKGCYSRKIVDQLYRAGKSIDLEPQFALLVDFASDASAVMGSGVSAMGGCIAIPTENTHGFELILEGSIEACAGTLLEFLINRPEGE
ncbi:zinc-binding metallopeptidase family protein [Pseudomonas mediterranea]|uniref:Aminopeptidase FrvX n=1 Tax=Pseudomonas mediterranea TaxID=183795 RepID=A0AAX2DDB3_9PSED|nr:peptidase M42 [Pseudomonas mediterranea]KGU83167.1 peptidase M42 [Pseudomonas mediterranea CFBP 5447]SDU57174.1 Putative aminopeptidase FrvX [Pseudomonas mediterranea]